MSNNKNNEIKISLDWLEQCLIKTGLAKYIDSLQNDYFITDDAREKEYILEEIADIEKIMSKLGGI